MSTRRPIPAVLGLVAGLVLSTLLLLPGVATGEARAAVVSPTADTTVSSPVDLRVRVTRDVLDPPVSRVEVRLSSDGDGGSGRTASLSCIEACESTESVWGGRVYDPRAPLGGGPVCNGRWYLQVALDGGGYGAPAAVVAAAPASPAGAVRVAIDGRDAHLTWVPAPEPDVSAYRIERRTAGGDWVEVGTTSGDRSTFVDVDVDEGDHEWRVVSLRPDGRSGGAAAAPCADTEADLATTSTVTRGRVTEPRPSPTPTETTSGADDADGDDDPTTGADDGASPSDGGGVPAGDANGADGAVAPAPDGSAGGESATAAPQDAPVAAPAEPAVGETERYYGEDHGVGELDYSGVVTETPETRAAGEPQGHWVPGGVSVFSESRLDQQRLLRPIAGGLVLLTFGFHLRRWQREHDA